MLTRALTRVPILSIVAWTVTTPVVAWALVRVFGLERGTPLVQLMAFTPYLTAGAVVVVAGALLARRWWAAGAAGLACLVLAGCVLPRTFSSPSTIDSVPLTVMSYNLLEGGADAEAVVRVVRERAVDVLTLQELTPAAVANLTEAGLASLLPYHTNHAVPGTQGSGLYARFPLSDTGSRLNPGGFYQVYATLEVPGAGSVAVESVHPLAPAGFGTTSRWREDLRGQRPAPASGPPQILAGDFNSTVDHAELRRLLATGYRDAASVVGAGLTPTWPYHGERALVTPKVALDHVLVDARVGVHQFSAITIAGSDHRAVVAGLVLPSR